MNVVCQVAGEAEKGASEMGDLRAVPPSELCYDEPGDLLPRLSLVRHSYGTYACSDPRKNRCFFLREQASSGIVPHRTSSGGFLVARA